MEVPVYLFTGFLESGKTSFIMDTIDDDYFSDGQKTLILACEEGEEEYDEELLKEVNAQLVTIETKEELTIEFIMACQSKYTPERVVIEYNGMWSLEDLVEVLDETPWMIYQILTTVDASTFDLYINNMRSMFIEMFKFSETIIYNRCDQSTAKATYRRSIRAVNKRAQVFFEMADGVEEEETQETFPFDKESDIIVINDEDYGIWYIDAMENPNDYQGKTIKMKAIVCKPDDLRDNIFIPGRFAMTCCADDIAFIGYICKTDGEIKDKLKNYKNRDWISLTAKVKVEYHEEYEAEGPVLYASSIEQAEKPEEDLIYF